MHKVLERRKEQTPEEQFVKFSIHSERQLTCLRFLHAQHSSHRLVSLRELGVGVTSVSAPQLSFTTGEGELARPSEADTHI